MTTKYLIFPIVFCDNDFEKFLVVKNEITSMDFNKLANAKKCRENIVYHLAKAAIDLEEIIKNKNSKGYRYNSYLLNMAALKLSFVVDLLVCNLSVDFEYEIKTVNVLIRSLSTILHEHYEDFLLEVNT